MVSGLIVGSSEVRITHLPLWAWVAVAVPTLITEISTLDSQGLTHEKERGEKKISIGRRRVKGREDERKMRASINVLTINSHLPTFQMLILFCGYFCLKMMVSPLKLLI